MNSRTAAKHPSSRPSSRQNTTGLSHDSTKGNGHRTPLRFAVLALLCWLPIPNGSRGDGWTAFAISAIAVLGFVNAAGYAQGIAHGIAQCTTHSQIPGCRVSSARVALSLLALGAAWTCAQYALGLSTDPGATLRLLLLSLAYLALFWLVVDLFRERRHLTWVLATLAVSGTLQAFYGAFMTLSGIEWLAFGEKATGRGVVTGTFVNRNHLAGYLELTLAAGIGLMLALRDHRPLDWRRMLELIVSPKVRIRLALAIMVIALVMTQSRMGNTAFFSSLLVTGLLFLIHHPAHRLRYGLILASLIVIDVVIISQYFGLENLRQRIVATQFEDEIVDGHIVRAENVDRDDVARYALDQIAERPYTGYGAGSFRVTYPNFAGPDIYLDFDHTHNDYLELVSDSGMVGLTPYAAFMLVCLWQALAALRDRASAYRSGVGFGATMGMLALLIHATTDFNLQVPANAATLVVMAAIGVLARSHVNASKPGPK